MKPQELIELSKEIIKLNNIQFGLSGSLMLYHRGIKTRREPADIDLVGMFERAESIKMPEGFVIIETDTTSGYIDAVTFYNESILQKVDFLYNTNEENFEEINGIDCTTVEYMAKAKLSYIKNDSSKESKIKHYEDLLVIREYLEDFQKDELDEIKIINL